MPFIHKYQQYSFGQGFETHNSILDTTPYKPEVIFIGTYNHSWSWNKSDFYYGRGMYMWPSLANLFLYNQNHLIKQRNFNNDIPSFNEILEICCKGKIVFADIVKGIKENIEAIEDISNKSVLVNNEYSWSSYKDGPLDYMGGKGWLDDNVSAIIDFINKHKTIKYIYFTFKSEKWLVNKIQEIAIKTSSNSTSCSIFTPTANGFRKNLNSPYNERLWSLTHCWVWNGLDNENRINKLGFGNVDHDWLIKNGVNPLNF